MKVYSRKEWGAPANRTLQRVRSDRRPSTRLIIHTEAGRVPTFVPSLELDFGHMRNIDRFHHDTRGWPGGIGYNGLVTASGRAFEGRGPWMRGGHTEGFNDSLALCFTGHGDVADATSAQWAGARGLIRHWIAIGALDARYVLTGHRDHIRPGSKSCPGALIFRRMHQELAAVVVAGSQQIGDDDMGYADWSDKDKAAFWADADKHLRLPVMYGLTGSEPADPGPKSKEWANLSKLANSTNVRVIESEQAVIEAVQESERAVRAGVLSAVIEAVRVAMQLAVDVAQAAGVDLREVKLPQGVVKR